MLCDLPIMIPKADTPQISKILIGGHRIKLLTMKYCQTLLRQDANKHDGSSVELLYTVYLISLLGSQHNSNTYIQKRVKLHQAILRKGMNNFVDKSNSSFLCFVLL